MNSKDKTVIILLGPPGSGKGTQAKRLSAELKIPHISTGDLFRENLSKDTNLGKKAKEYIHAGKLVPDELVIEMLMDRIRRSDCDNGYLLDGFPRTIPQAEVIDRFLEELGNRTSVLNLDVADDNVIKRISGRLTCSQCGHLHNRYFSPPTHEGLCDLCGAQLLQRADDKQEIVEERLRVYKAQTEPLINHYKVKGILADVDGELEPETVFYSLLALLK